MPGDATKHWENVYRSKAPTEVSWYQAHNSRSLALLASTPRDACIIDVGGGASTLVDDLSRDGFQNLTVLDISAGALAASKQRLGHLAERVRWIESNILDAALEHGVYDVWHDRAAFHFLVDAQDRRDYVQKVMRAVKPGGLVMVATFAEDGPTTCSGLPVMRYSPSELSEAFGDSFEPVRDERETHKTPSGTEQRFLYCVFRKL